MSGDLEKAPDGVSVDHVNKTTTQEASDIDVDDVYSYAEQRKIIHRVDRRLVSICGLGYCISLMDRTNLSVAAIAGMTKELELHIGFRYSIVALVFFITYILCQPPMTAAIRKLGPKNFISFIIFTWGVCLIGFGLCKNWEQLTALRALLGVLEAGFFPGTVYLLSTWYSRYEVQKRYSIFYLIGCVAAALSGILAFGFSQMSGIQGMLGWRWIFIMQGLLTIVVAIVTYIFLVDFPDKAYKAWAFLNQDECAFIIRRLNKDRGDADAEPFTIKRFLRPALDLKIWGFGMIFFCLTTVTYAIAYFLPIILHDNMGFSVSESQCLVAPPYVVAGILMFSSSWVADKYKMRAPILVFNSLVTIVGLPIMGFAENNVVRYFGVFLTTAGANANIPCSLAYQANNIRGQWTRALASTTLVAMGGVGGVAGSLVFRSQDAPEYIPGIYAAIACQFLLLLIVGSLSLYFWRCNKKADRGELVIEGSPTFRYTL
ncbi:phthalate transporter [Blastomyces gilchristii SLH14081]|uniref:Phthalate transporter n=1 Tax=Blastomyces gilchristii (strain SLH14081) TaxID=559298 RepID=A0A179UZR3_BLAGS|nr:phthalate transporter [Blastomyces gilchristii SLH14081]OAT12627.1 phthalate transporter [Blastomyces gilchristii SLH14081]